MSKKYKAIVIGASAGGLEALVKILMPLPKDFSLPIIIVQHISPDSDNYMTQYLNSVCDINIKEADEKEKIKAGNVYIAPPNYHLLIEENFTLSLSNQEKVNFSRPSIDVLFETAAYAYGSTLIGVILTGANNDGSKGMKLIHNFNGLTIAQDPKTAYVDNMPLAAIKATKIDYILPLEKIAELLIKIHSEQKKKIKNNL